MGILLVLFCSFRTGAQVEDAGKRVLFSQDRSREVSLDGEWRFLFCSGGSVPDGCLGMDADDSAWDRVQVPMCWDAQGYADPRYVNPHRAAGVYRRDFRVPRRWLRDGRVYLRFDGVLKGYEVWVNGRFAGKWESAFNSCHFDVTDYVHPGNNLLAVKVYTEYKGADFDSNDDWGQAGINRHVSVFPVQDIHIGDITVSTTHVSEDGAMLHYSIRIDSFSSEKPKGRVRIAIRDRDGKKVLSRKLSAGGGVFISDSVELTRPYLWNAESPNLYTLECRAGRKDRQRVVFGVREVKVEGNVLKLNGRPLKLRGVNLHDTDPMLGKVITRELLLKDLVMMKQANVNFIRTCHYPKAPEFYDLCDSMGFYVMDEVPFGFGDSHLSDSTYLDILLTRADATVSRDKNHPCVIVWSVGNENPLTPIAEETGRYVKSADPTRPICYPMIHDYFLSLDYDIPEFVDIFAPHYPPVPTLLKYAAEAERPVIATEYCHSLGQSLEQLDELWEIMQSNPNLAGGAVWEWSDQGMPARNEEFPGVFAATEKLWLRDSTCISMEGNSGTDGIVYADRTPLSNYYELRADYSQARLITDTLKAVQGMNHLTLSFVNRYDYTDLSDDIRFEWRFKEGDKVLDNGVFSVVCAPGAFTEHTIDLNVPGDPAMLCYSLGVSVLSQRWGLVGEYSLPVVSGTGEYAGALYALGSAPETDAPVKMPEMFLRTGRKRGLAEQIRARGAAGHYLVRPDWGIDGRVRFENEEFSARGTVVYQSLQDGCVRVEADIIPLTEGKLLLEGGLAFLMEPGVEYVQWLGQGPFATYPGKNKANMFGVHALKAGDLYFEGNRMGVDAVLATDASGNGWLFLCKGISVDFERTDAGLTVSLNDKVSGMCGKLRNTSFPVFSSSDEPMQLTFIMLPVRAGQWPDAVPAVFRDPSGIECFQPFLTQYDTYSLPLSDIL